MKALLIETQYLYTHTQLTCNTTIHSYKSIARDSSVEVSLNFRAVTILVLTFKRIGVERKMENRAPERCPCTPKV